MFRRPVDRWLVSTRVFSDVHLEAEQVTEMHRTQENDLTITEQELPGMVNVYLVIDGGRVLLDQLKAPVVLEAIAAQAKKQAQADEQAQADAQQAEPAQAEPAADTSQPQG